MLLHLSLTFMYTHTYIHTYMQYIHRRHFENAASAIYNIRTHTHIHTCNTYKHECMHAHIHTQETFGDWYFSYPWKTKQGSRVKVEFLKVCVCMYACMYVCISIYGKQSKGHASRLSFSRYVYVCMHVCMYVFLFLEDKARVTRQS